VRFHCHFLVVLAFLVVVGERVRLAGVCFGGCSECGSGLSVLICGRGCEAVELLVAGPGVSACWRVTR